MSSGNLDKFEYLTSDGLAAKPKKISVLFIRQSFWKADKSSSEAYRKTNQDLKIFPIFKFSSIKKLCQSIDETQKLRGK